MKASIQVWSFSKCKKVALTFSVWRFGPPRTEGRQFPELLPCVLFPVLVLNHFIASNCVLLGNHKTQLFPLRGLRLVFFLELVKIQPGHHTPDLWCF